MSDTTKTTYTAKLTDGPLEGRTVATGFLDDGRPKPTVEIPAAGGKTYVYARSSGQEFESAGSALPSAVAYRFLTTNFS